MIVVTTPTGNIGQQVLENLLDAGESVRVIVRAPSRLPAQTRDRVEVVQGSHGDLAVVTEAFAGADGVFWLVPPASKADSLEAAYSGFTRPACQAIQSQGVKRVVGVSSLGRGTKFADHAGLVTASLQMDDLLASAGVDYRALAMPSFMDNTLRQVDSIKNQGLFFGQIAPDRPAPTCATSDIASIATKFLRDSSWSGVGDVPVLGPEDLSFNDMADIISDVLGKPVRYQQVPFEAFKARLKENGMSEAFAQGYMDMMIAKNEGIDNVQPRTPEFTTPTTFRQWCEEILKPAVQG